MLHREEIAGERVGSLLAQERPPRLPCALGRRRNARANQDLAHSCRRNRQPQALKLARDPLITPVSVVLAFVDEVLALKEEPSTA